MLKLQSNMRWCELTTFLGGLPLSPAHSSSVYTVLLSQPYFLTDFAWVFHQFFFYWKHFVYRTFYVWVCAKNFNLFVWKQNPKPELRYGSFVREQDKEPQMSSWELLHSHMLALGQEVFIISTISIYPQSWLNLNNARVNILNISITSRYAKCRNVKSLTNLRCRSCSNKSKWFKSVILSWSWCAY